VVQGEVGTAAGEGDAAGQRTRAVGSGGACLLPEAGAEGVERELGGAEAGRNAQVDPQARRRVTEHARGERGDVDGPRAEPSGRLGGEGRRPGRAGQIGASRQPRLDRIAERRGEPAQQPLVAQGEDEAPGERAPPHRGAPVRVEPQHGHPERVEEGQAALLPPFHVETVDPVRLREIERERGARSSLRGAHPRAETARERAQVLNLRSRGEERPKRAGTGEAEVARRREGHAGCLALDAQFRAEVQIPLAPPACRQILLRLARKIDPVGKGLRKAGPGDAQVEPPPFIPLVGAVDRPLPEAPRQPQAGKAEPARRALEDRVGALAPQFRAG